MASPLPRFKNPPVRETVIGLQFAPLPGFSTAHAGKFWAQHLGSEWASAVDAPPLPDQYEFFDARRWSPEPVRFTGTWGPDRVHIVAKEDDRLLQIQSTRFIYNWRHRGGEYPSYSRLLPEYQEHLRAFSEFATRNGLGSLDPNQWEITYVNPLIQGELWDSLEDVRSLLPGLYIPPDCKGDLSEPGGLRFDGLSCRWQMAIGLRGRLHVSIQHGRLVTGEREVLTLSFTARGPVEGASGLTEWAGLDIGHEAIVRCFAAMTSERAHAHWGRMP